MAECFSFQPTDGGEAPEGKIGSGGLCDDSTCTGALGLFVGNSRWERWEVGGTRPVFETRRLLHPGITGVQRNTVLACDDDDDEFIVFVKTEQTSRRWEEEKQFSCSRK